MARTRIMPPAQVRRTLRRLAYEIVEHTQGADEAVLFGIERSGVPLAEAVAAEVALIAETDCAAHPLDVTPFRDDRPDSSPPASAPLALDTTDRDVILIDDVVFTGRTARAALDAVLQYGRPRSIQLQVLVDRGHREYPIQPDSVGRRLQTKPAERVVVAPEDDGFAVYVDGSS